MRRKITLALFVCLFSVGSLLAQNNLRINETETTAVFVGNRLHANLVVENPLRMISAKINLEVLNSKDEFAALGEAVKVLKNGKQIVQFQLVLSKSIDAEELLWHRLRYSISQDNGSNFSSGIISLSEIMPELFELRISAPENVFAGMKFTSHILALHPITKKPVKNVAVSADIELELDADSDEDELKITAKGKTNDEGFATLAFEIPANAKLEVGSYNGEIKVKGEKGGVVREADENLRISSDAFVYLSTDKPIYQPDQKLYVRGLFLNSLKKPINDADLTFEITDEEGETVFTQSVKTSRFGVSSIEWKIPENIKLGTYKIEVQNENEDEVGLAEIKITRYDLPNYKVIVKTDRTFYLPTQNSAEITVSADYLFGKPVEKGRVKIVNIAEDELDPPESGTREGETDAEGKFTANFDLTKAFEDLKNDGWKRFADLKFVAYFTDPTTNRTEQKRFDLRISIEPIHIYLFIYGSDVNPKLPYQFYVSTFYPDGAAARSDLKIKGNYQGLKSEEALVSGKTNAYGAKKFEIRIPEKPLSNLENKFILEIYARDKEGNTGSYSDNLYIDKDLKQVFVETGKTIYLPNQPIEARILSTESNETVFVDVLKNSSVIYSKRILLKDRSESFRIPYQSDFEGELTIAVYVHDEDRYNSTIYQAKTIIYPSPDKLDFNLKSLKAVYRPGEEAKLDFKMRDGKMNPVETALGIVVLDKAIEERAEAEQIGNNFTSIRKLLGTADSFGNLTRRDLQNLDPAKPITEDFQLAAEFLLVRKSYQPQFFESDSYLEDFGRIYKDYFQEKLKPLETTINTHYEKTSEFPADEKSLREILSKSNIDFDDLRDAWGMPFQTNFEFDRNIATFSLKSSSGDKKVGTLDDFNVKKMNFRRFAALQNRLNVIFNNAAKENKSYPKSIDELKMILKNGGIDLEALRDEWNRPFYLTATNYEHITSRVQLENVGNLDGETQQVVKSQPVLQELVLFRLKSAGKDGIDGQYDDYDVAAFTSILSEKSLLGDKILATISKGSSPNSRGAVGGAILDPVGAVIPNSVVTAENQQTFQKHTVATNNEGYYLFSNLPTGKYNIKAESPGFKVTQVQNVIVSSMNIITLNITLEIGDVSSVVQVTSAAETIVNTSSAAISMTVSKTDVTIAGILKNAKNNSLSTPRVREYFPETLVWQPEIITDKKGRARFDFKLADGLTTWKLYAIGSTATGEIGLLEKEIQTFQPFFAELDPPKILTEGDEISLPTPVRNYTDKRQNVSVTMAENNWSTSLNGATQYIEIAPNSTQNAIFDFRANTPVADAKQKITAIAKNESDAVEKSLTVKPNGREIIQIQSSLFSENAAFDVNYPGNAFSNTLKTELKIYPNTLAHVGESVEGLLQRPHGCGEQTTSSTYPNLLILKLEKDFGKSLEPKIKRQAEVYLQEGYTRLLNYQTPGGGFSFWGKTDVPKIALTAYVLRFLNDAADFIEVDENVIESANKWLLAQQNQDGSWNGSADITAYVARSISLNLSGDAEKKKALSQSFDFLRTSSNERNTSYYLSNFALALIENGDLQAAETIAEKLRSLGKSDKLLMFWEAQSTPFYGWGNTANIETTALVLQVFIRLKDAGLKVEKATIKNQYLNEISSGLRFLLKNKDKFGVWYSTQTTVNVLDSLILLQKSFDYSAQNNKAEIFVNDVKFMELTFAETTLANPLFIDLSSALNSTGNRIEIRGGSKSDLLMAQLIAKHYVDWNAAVDPDSNYFDLRVGCDRLQANIGEEITCSVNIERKTYKGNGMILAEIGIPPGADVDRSSLEKIVNAKNGISRYDVLPDRVIVYAWIGSNPIDFNFKFKPRYAINAQTPASIAYDYYNPEAQALVAPMKFAIK